MWQAFLSFLFPSWIFFDETDDLPFILYKTNLNSKWEILFKPTSPSTVNLFLNAKINLYLYHQTLIHRLLNFLTSKENIHNEELEKNESYQFFKNAVTQRYTDTPQFKSFIFKLSYIKLNHKTDFFEVTEDIFISKEYYNGN